jgi:hypothetical protein
MSFFVLHERVRASCESTRARDDADAKLASTHATSAARFVESLAALRFRLARDVS